MNRDSVFSVLFTGITNRYEWDGKASMHFALLTFPAGFTVI
jgi:hypothetical protein